MLNLFPTVYISKSNVQTYVMIYKSDVLNLPLQMCPNLLIPLNNSALK